MARSVPKGRGRKTRDRILEASLRLFNDFGEPNVTTNQIADEIDISPGNLHYHFKTKAEIVHTLFERYRRRIRDVLVVPEGPVSHIEDMWLYLHLVFESIWAYRFIYRDLNNLLGRYPKLRRGVRKIMETKAATASVICEALVEGGIMSARPSEIDVLSVNMALVGTYWLSYENVAGTDLPVDQELSRGVYHVMMLGAPYLEPEARGFLESLARRYLEN